uniref:Alkaline ceramidase n=1 Tax=Caenorhabditis tropicalis TaxID=1561998 RepID=A0A1I7TFJ0_9PELO
MDSKSISRWFEYESGHAWCESAYKYQTLPYVAEFANTCTNLPIIVLPLVNIMLLRRYLQDVNGGLVFPQLLLTFNGLASTYYHATLNLFGQLVDELSLVWIITVFLVVYIPVMKWFPEKFSKRLTLVRWIVLIVTAAVSGLCFLEPNLNAIALMLFSIPAAVVINYEGNRTPYLHALFHLLAGLAGYTIFIMFSMIDIESRTKTHRYTAAVRYFPDKNGSIFSFPYISLKERSQ